LLHEEKNFSDDPKTLYNINRPFACFLAAGQYRIKRGKERINVVKQEAIEGIRTLPDNVTWDDIMYYLYVNQKIEKGLRDIKYGAVYTHDEAREKLRMK